MVMLAFALLAFGMMMVVFLPYRANDHVYDLMMRGIVSFSLLIAGIVMMLFTGIYDPQNINHYDTFLDNLEITGVVLWIGIDLFTIMLINYITFTQTPLLTSFEVFPTPFMSFMWFSAVVGLMEEVLFRGWLQIWATRFAGVGYAIIVTNLTWWLFHIYVYVLDPSAMIIILGSGFILSLSLIFNRNRLSVTMAPHGLNNLLASLVKNSFVKGTIIAVTKVLVK